MSQKLLPQIEEGIEKSGVGEYRISMRDMIMNYFPQFMQERLSLESVFCILSSVLWPHYISTDINYDAENFCLYIIFTKPAPRGDEPSVKNCTEKWMTLYTEP